MKKPNLSRKGPNVCPGCGEPVSPFAAGCAICGAELDPHRGDRPAGIRKRVAAAWRAKRRLPRIPMPDRRS